MALNVSCAMEGFAQITPCGLVGRPVGRLSDWLPGLTIAEVQPLVRLALARRFGLAWTAES